MNAWDVCLLCGGLWVLGVVLIVMFFMGAHMREKGPRPVKGYPMYCPSCEKEGRPFVVAWTTCEGSSAECPHHLREQTERILKWAAKAYPETDIEKMRANLEEAADLREPAKCV